MLAANPDAHGTLFDRPHVVSRAAEELRKTELAGRCRIIGGDFFEEVPGGGEAYILKSILHDWDDDQCVAILKSCRRAMQPDGALIVIENVLGSPNDYPDHMDLTMLVVTGGVERTQEEFASLYRNAGFSLMRVFSLGSSACILEGMPIAE